MLFSAHDGSPLRRQPRASNVYLLVMTWERCAGATVCLHPECASNILTTACYTSGSVQSQSYRIMRGNPQAMPISYTTKTSQPGRCGQSPGTSHTLEDMDMAKGLELVSVANLVLPMCSVITHCLLGNLDRLLTVLRV